MIAHLLIDFDSTFTKVEALEELAEISLADHPEKRRLLAEVRALTDAGMEGILPFASSLQRRLRLLQAHRRHLPPLVEKLRGNVSASIERNRKFFLQRELPCYIVSSGFREFIEPVVAGYGISGEHVLANTFKFASDGRIIGCDECNLLAQDGGKVMQVRQLALSGGVCVLGDGYTDWEIRGAGLADRFVAFTENVARPAVTARADEVVANFDEFLAGLGK